MSMLMGLGVYFVRFLSLPGAAALLLVQVLVGIVLYAGLSYVLGLPAFLEAAHAAGDRLRMSVLSPGRS
jgi:hypothetical protein